MLPALRPALDGREHPGRLRQVIFLTDGAVGNEDAALRGDPRAPRRQPPLHDRHRLGAQQPLHARGGAARARHVHLHRQRRRGEGQDGRALREARVAGADRRRDRAAVRRGRDRARAASPTSTSASRSCVALRAPRAAVAGRARAAASARGVGARAGRSSRRGRGRGPLRRTGRAGRSRRCSTAAGRASTEDEVRPAVLELALEHHLVSPYTSLVAVDVTPVRPGDEALTSHPLADESPARLGLHRRLRSGPGRHGRPAARGLRARRAPPRGSARRDGASARGRS